MVEGGLVWGSHRFGDGQVRGGETVVRGGSGSDGAAEGHSRGALLLHCCWSPAIGHGRIGIGTTLGDCHAGWIGVCCVCMCLRGMVTMF